MPGWFSVEPIDGGGVSRDPIIAWSVDVGVMIGGSELTTPVTAEGCDARYVLTPDGQVSELAVRSWDSLDEFVADLAGRSGAT